MEYEWLVYGGVALVGLISTIIYYAARFYFRLGEEESSKEQIEVQKEKESKEGLEAKISLGLEEQKDMAPTVQPELVGEAESEEKIQEIEKPKSAPPVGKPKELKEALEKTKKGFFSKIKGVFGSKESLSDDDLEELEEALYTSDLGPQTVQRLIEAVGDQLTESERANFDKVCETLRSEMLNIFSKFSAETEDEPLLLKELSTRDKPQVWMIVGVNGAGKTTTIGKLAYATAAKGLKTLVVAGDTFRAAAGEQLNVWKQRAGVEIFSPEGITDPSAVAFDGCQMAKGQEYDVVILDTAGRLHTQDNLMDELKKMKRVVKKVLPEAPHETLIVLDANSGQNALMQTQKFDESIGLSGVVLTKLDGSAKGGVAVGLANEFSLPIKVIGVGEGIEDLRAFQPKEFVASII